MTPRSEVELEVLGCRDLMLGLAAGWPVALLYTRARELLEAAKDAAEAEKVPVMTQVAAMLIMAAEKAKMRDGR